MSSVEITVFMPACVSAEAAQCIRVGYSPQSQETKIVIEADTVTLGVAALAIMEAYQNNLNTLPAAIAKQISDEIGRAHV